MLTLFYRYESYIALVDLPYMARLPYIALFSLYVTLFSLYVYVSTLLYVHFMLYVALLYSVIASTVLAQTVHLMLYFLCILKYLNGLNLPIHRPII